MLASTNYSEGKMYIVLIPWLRSEIYEPLWLFCLCKYFCNACWFLFRQNRANLNKVHAWNLFLPFFFRQKKNIGHQESHEYDRHSPSRKKLFCKNQDFFLKKIWTRFASDSVFFSNDTFLNQKSPSLTRDKHKKPTKKFPSILV